MKNLTLTLIILIGLTGCQSIPTERDSSQTTTKEDDNVTILNVYEQSKKSYNVWLIKITDSENLKIYSSDLYNDLLTYWSDSIEIYDDFSDSPAKATKNYSLFSTITYAEKFDEELADVESTYEKLLSLKEKANIVLAESITQLEYLDSMNADELYPSQYKNIYNDYVNLFETVSKNEIADAKTGQIEFLKKTKALEIEMVIKKYISPLKKEFNLLKKENIKNTAAISYSRVKTEFDSAVSVIKSETRNVILIEQVVKKVKFQLAHLENVANEVKLLSNVKNNKFEPTVLEIENKLLSISSALSRSDYRNQPREKQIELILTAIKELHANKDTERLTTQLEKLKLFNTAQIEELDKFKKENESLINKIKELEAKTE